MNKTKDKKSSSEKGYLKINRNIKTWKETNRHLIVRKDHISINIVVRSCFILWSWKERNVKFRRKEASAKFTLESQLYIQKDKNSYKVK